MRKEGELGGITRLACVGIDVTNGIWNVVAVVTKYNCTCIKCETCVQKLRSGYLLEVMEW
jgi:hypothetical protein